MICCAFVVTDTLSLSRTGWLAVHVCCTARDPHHYQVPANTATCVQHVLLQLHPLISHAPHITLSRRLVRLDLGCVRLARDPSTVLMEPLASLTALSDLRMSVYSNGDATLTLQLSQLCALSNLQASGCLPAAAAISLTVHIHWCLTDQL
jgi:hypothetical protein